MIKRLTCMNMPELSFDRLFIFIYIIHILYILRVRKTEKIGMLKTIVWWIIIDFMMVIAFIFYIASAFCFLFVLFCFILVWLKLLALVVGLNNIYCNWRTLICNIHTTYKTWFENKPVASVNPLLSVVKSKCKRLITCICGLINPVFLYMKQTKIWSRFKSTL